ncbi:YciI family protein [Dyadobacter aurulentus]|uniref:YciI family protein n=1 Tax=Dyadobacter sp. UC 10 TaxID=2605428 RepID=UPI001788A517|nr:YciI family protein [Dyadobacter sp. UC 10]
MKKYLVLYKAPVGANKQMEGATAEQQVEGMKAWMDWAQKCGGRLVDMGQPLANGLSLSSTGSSSAHSQIAGFSILQVADMHEAESLMQGHPHLAWNAECRIELHETQPVPGM